MWQWVKDNQVFSGVGSTLLLLGVGAFKFLRNKKEKKIKSLDERKSITRILFIDDQTFRVPDILIKSGWINTKKVKDIKSIDALEVKEAHILFVDIQGVGKQMKFGEEGLALALALKQKYPNKKVIIYSSENTGDRFHKALQQADASLPKNADPYEFQQLVEQFSEDVNIVNESI